MNILKNHPSVLLLSNLTTAPPASKTENGNEVFLSFNHKQTKAVVRRCSVKKVFLKFVQNSQENNCACEFCEISKNTSSYRTPPVAASRQNICRIFQVLAQFSLATSKSSIIIIINK